MDERASEGTREGQSGAHKEYRKMIGSFVGTSMLTAAKITSKTPTTS